MIEISNHGSLVTRTNYWGSEYDRAGKLFCSVNAGAVRLLLPRSLAKETNEMRTAEYVVLSRGPWPDEGADEAVELLFEDRSQSPYCLHLTANSFDVLPAEPEPGREWVFTVWVPKKGRPHKALERPCKWRRSERLPDLSPWSE